MATVGKQKQRRGGRYTPPAVACLLCEGKVRSGDPFMAMQIGVPGAYEPGIAHTRCASAAAADVEADGGSVVYEPLTPELVDEVASKRPATPHEAHRRVVAACCRYRVTLAA